MDYVRMFKKEILILIDDKILQAEILNEINLLNNLNPFESTLQFLSLLDKVEKQFDIIIERILPLLKIRLTISSSKTDINNVKNYIYKNNF